MNFMKDNIIPYLSVVVVSTLLLYIPYSKADLTLIDVVGVKYSNTIEKQHKNDKLVIKKEYGNIVYYYYNVNDNNESIFVNNKEKKIDDIYSIIKSDKTSEFDEKINSLLNLKYPKFIVDAINESSTKIYELNDNRMTIYYKDVNIEGFDEDIFLIVNYNEIKEYLDITVQLDSVYENENGYNYSPNKKSIAITFDDGPNGEKTLELLKILEENKAHATFFMVGNRMDNFKTTVTSVYNSGNEIGSHTYAHKSFKKMSLEEAIETEELTDKKFNELTGGHISLTRPPYGAIDEKTKDGVDRTFVNWSVDTLDWSNKDPEKIKEIILENISDGDIILFHDLYQTSVDATREMLPILYKQGYQVMSVSELAKIKGKTLEKNTIYRKISNETDNDTNISE